MRSSWAASCRPPGRLRWAVSASRVLLPPAATYWRSRSSRPLPVPGLVVEQRRRARTRRTPAPAGRRAAAPSARRAARRRCGSSAARAASGMAAATSATCAARRSPLPASSSGAGGRADAQHRRRPRRWRCRAAARRSSTASTVGPSGPALPRWTPRSSPACWAPTGCPGAAASAPTSPDRPADADRGRQPFDQRRGSRSCSATGSSAASRPPAPRATTATYCGAGAQAERAGPRRRGRLVADPTRGEVGEQTALGLQLQAEPVPLDHPAELERLGGPLEHHRQPVLGGAGGRDDQPSPAGAAAAHRGGQPALGAGEPGGLERRGAAGPRLPVGEQAGGGPADGLEREDVAGEVLQHHRGAAQRGRGRHDRRGVGVLQAEPGEGLVHLAGELDLGVLLGDQPAVDLLGDLDEADPAVQDRPPGSPAARASRQHRLGDVPGARCRARRRVRRRRRRRGRAGSRRRPRRCRPSPGRW